MNDFPVPSTSVPMADPGANALVAREVQSVQGAIISAKKFPRDQGAALKRIEDACQRVRLAEQGLYSYPRGGQEVTGPSIRLAECIAQYWGNIDTGWRVLSQTPSESYVQTWAWDLETNYRKPIEFTVPHVRDTKKGSYALTDQRDIYELIANQASRRQRNCILAVVPGDVTEAAVAACESTLANQGKIEEKRQKVVDAFKAMDVSADEIERRIGKKISAMSSTDYVQLQKIWKSLKDGMSKKDDWFESILDPAKIKREADEAVSAAALSTPIEQANIATDKRNAISEFTRAAESAKKIGGDPVKILGMGLNEVLLKDANFIAHKADILAQWRPV